jgi:hypothetical protein
MVEMRAVLADLPTQRRNSLILDSARQRNVGVDFLNPKTSLLMGHQRENFTHKKDIQK